MRLYIKERTHFLWGRLCGNNEFLSRLTLVGFFVIIVAYSLHIFHVMPLSISTGLFHAQVADSPVSERRYWEREIDELGPEKAYQVFKDMYAKIGITKAHTKAHIFGEALFNKRGLEGAHICDEAYNYGCYHSFFAKTIGAYGVSILPILSEECGKKRNPGVCLHGIGHGLQWYFGDEHLLESLSECSKIPAKNPVVGCGSGVFMEYNMRNAEDPALVQIRPPDGDHLQSPCDKVPRKYGQACYFEQPRWWDQLFKHDYQKIRDLCEEVKDESLRETCFFGLGHIEVATQKNGYDVAHAIAGCTLAPDRRALVACRSGVAWSFFVIPEVAEKYPLICEEGLSVDEKSQCMNFALFFNE